MRSKITKTKEKRDFKQGDILEYIQHPGEKTKIIVLFLENVSSINFRGICLYSEETDGWTVGEMSDDIMISSFQFFEGALELSN